MVMNAMTSKKQKIILAALAAAFSMNAQALDLLDTWQAALNRDPEYLASRYAQMAGEKRRDQALALWLPTIVATGTTGVMSSNSRTTGAQFYNSQMSSSPFNNSTFNTSINGGNLNTYAFTLQQPIFNLEKLAQARQLKLSANASDLQQKIGYQNLIMLVAERYFDLLQAQENLYLAKKQREAIQQMYGETQKRFTLGNVSRTDVQEASEKVELANLRVNDAASEVGQRELALQDLAGSFKGVKELNQKLVSGNMKLASLEDYVQRLKSQSPGVKLSEMEQLTLKQELEKYSLASSAKLDLVASAGRDSLVGNGDYGAASNATTNNMVGLKLTVPLFTGGYRSARQNELINLVEKAKYDHEKIVLDNERALRTIWFSVKSSHDRIAMLTSRKKASQERLSFTRTAHGTGSRTTMELLGAESDAIAAEHELYAEKVNFILNRMRLDAMVGELTDAQLEQANKLLM